MPVQEQVTVTAAAPQMLHISSPNWQQECAGEYDLVQGSMANGQPLWKKRSGERWLYFNTNGCWIVGGVTEWQLNFQCTNGYILNNRPNPGVTPDLLGPGWILYDGTQWRQDDEVTVTVAGQPSTHAGTAGQPPSQTAVAATEADAQTPQPAASDAGTGAGASSAGAGASLVDAILQGVAGDSWDDDEPSPDVGNVIVATPQAPAAAAATPPAVAEAEPDAAEDSWDMDLPLEQPGGDAGNARQAPAPKAVTAPPAKAAQQGRSAEADLDSWDDDLPIPAVSKAKQAARPARTAEDSWDRDSDALPSGRAASAAGQQQPLVAGLEDSWESEGAPAGAQRSAAGARPAVGIGGGTGAERFSSTRAGAAVETPPSEPPDEAGGGSWDDDDDDLLLAGLEGAGVRSAPKAAAKPKAAPAKQPAAKPVAAAPAAAKPAVKPAVAKPAAKPARRTPPASARMADLGFDSDDAPAPSDGEEENSWD